MNEIKDSFYNPKESDENIINKKKEGIINKIEEIKKSYNDIYFGKALDFFKEKTILEIEKRNDESSDLVCGFLDYIDKDIQEFSDYYQRSTSLESFSSREYIDLYFKTINTIYGSPKWGE